MTLLAVENLCIEFATPAGRLIAVDNLSFNVDANEIVAILGESGCGKSVTALSLIRLIREPSASIKGVIRFDGRDILKLDERELRSLRGNQISMIFQEPMTSLNPVLTVGRQIGEAICLHQGATKKEARKRTIEMLDLVGISDPPRRVREYPHQLSGGMRQRVMIAMGLACNPRLLIADEPTTALDVTIQAQVLDLLRDLKHQFSSSIVLITHDLGVVAEMAERVIVMYAGTKVEEAPIGDLFGNPRHPYTQALLSSVPKLGSSIADAGRSKLYEIPGTVPSLTNRPKGCLFAGRCAYATDLCRTATPALRNSSAGHSFACHYEIERQAA